MTVTVAKTAGFCYGVKRAVELAQQAARDGKPCVMLGPIIHNAHVVDALAEQGIGCVSSPEASAPIQRWWPPPAGAGRHWWWSPERNWNNGCKMRRNGRICPSPWSPRQLPQKKFGIQP